MKRVYASAALVALLTGGAFSQTTSTSTSAVFEVADIHPTPSSVTPFMRGGFLSGGRYELHAATLVDLIKTAYGVESESVFGGPSWLDADRFEVLAKAAPRSTEADRRVMLQALLADRFKLVVHKDNKPLDVFALRAGKKVQLKEAAGTGEMECKPPDSAGKGPQPYIVLECRNMSMADFATQFHQMANGYVTHPMVDLTELKGTYDFTIKWTGRGALRAQQNGADADGNPGISFFDAVDKQLGLKLTEEKLSQPAIVVDSVNRAPTPNAPGVTTKIPEAPTEFEAASVKLHPAGDNMRRIQPKPGGRIEVENIPLKMLIGLAWNLDREQDSIIGGPKWIESESFDIVAKTADFKVSAPPDFDTVRLMLRPLLMERFKLVVHKEDQPVPVWTLVVSKRGLKLKEADPASRSGCKPSMGDSGRGSAAVPMISYVCQNTTMAQLVEGIRNVAGGYVDKPAVDATGLTGAYDFTISWTPKGVITGAGKGDKPAEGAPGSDASDPSGGITFFDAIEKQLGLRFEGGQKHAMPVLVIDHVEHLTEN